MKTLDLDRSTKHSRRSQMFVIRLWQEHLGGDQYEWRASLRHVSSGETRYLRSLHDLEDILKTYKVDFPKETPAGVDETPPEGII